MARKFKDLDGQSIEATNGEIGKIKDILFDDQTWEVRYFVVDTGKWLPGRKVLISPTSFSTMDVQSQDNLIANLTKEQIKDSPALETDLPVSKQYERSLHSYYGWTPYWGLTGPGAIFPYRDAPFNSKETSYTLGHADWPTLEQERKGRFDGHLRSLDEVTGYKISTTDDDEFGEVSDAIIDDKDWYVIDLILNSRKWLPGGKEFVCSPMFIKDIDEASRLLHLAQHKRSLIDGPDFNFDTYGEAYRKSLVQYYSSKPLDREKKPAHEHRA